MRASMMHETIIRLVLVMRRVFIFLNDVFSSLLVPDRSFRRACLDLIWLPKLRIFLSTQGKNSVKLVLPVYHRGTIMAILKMMLTERLQAISMLVSFCLSLYSLTVNLPTSQSSNGEARLRLRSRWRNLFK